MFHLLYGFVAEAFKKTEYKILLVGPESSGKTTALEQLKTAHAETPGLPNHQIVPTVGLNIARLDAPSGCRLVVWDLGGRVGLRSIWERYYDEAHAVIFCVDLAALEGEGGDRRPSSPPREGAEGEGSPLRGEGGKDASASNAAADAYFADAVSALRRLTRSDALRGAPVLILANKSDAVRSPERAARAAEALAHAAFFDDEEWEDEGEGEEGAGSAALGEAAGAETRAWRVASACAAEGLGLSESLEWLEARVGACERTERLARRAR